MHELARSEVLLMQRSFEYAHSENCTVFSASVREVSVRACAKFHCERARVHAHLRLQCKRTWRFHCSSTLTVELHSRSVASLTVKLCCRPCLQRVRLQRSFECARSKVWRVLEASTALEASHCRSFDPFEWVEFEASIHSQFFLFPPKQVDGPN